MGVNMSSVSVSDSSFEDLTHTSDGSVAAIGPGQEPFFLEDIGPDSTISGTVAFDVRKRY